MPILIRLCSFHGCRALAPASGNTLLQPPSSVDSTHSFVTYQCPITVSLMSSMLRSLYSSGGHGFKFIKAPCLFFRSGNRINVTNEYYPVWTCVFLLSLPNMSKSSEYRCCLPASVKFNAGAHRHVDRCSQLPSGHGLNYLFCTA